MMTSTTILTMKRRFDVSSDQVFDAWVHTEKMKKWFFTMEHTNKVAKNEPRVGGIWEIIDHREGIDYRATGAYIEIDRPMSLAFTFKMPQFNEEEDRIRVEFKPLDYGCEMTFTQEMAVPREDGWSETDVEKAIKELYDGSKYGWNLMFLRLKQLVETGKIDYPV